MAQVPTLLTVPNVSEGRDQAVIGAIGRAFAPAGQDRVHLLDVHSDPDHHRSVFTLAGRPQDIAAALRRGAEAAIELIDLTAHPGLHPHVGALDVAPVVHLDPERRGAACAEALTAAELIGELGVPVLLYGALTRGRTRAEIRRGGPAALAERLRAADLASDFGPPEAHPTAGTTLVAARPPLVAFNLELEPAATLEDARRIAAAIRGEHLKAIGLTLPNRGGVAQVSCNVEDHLRVPLASVVAAVRRHAPVVATELVGLAPRAAFAGFPDDVEVRNRRTVEDALEALGL
jgi:glutamate formiminotransferase/glutamate formiminotransferase/formiminotetrahydrofolate cyclodeaminase